MKTILETRHILTFYIQVNPFYVTECSVQTETCARDQNKLCNQPTEISHSQSWLHVVYMQISGCICLTNLMKKTLGNIPAENILK